MKGRTFWRGRSCSCISHISRPGNVRCLLVLDGTFLPLRLLCSGILGGCCLSSGGPLKVGRFSRGLALLCFQWLEVSNVGYGSLPLAGLFPDGLDLHPNPNV